MNHKFIPAVAAFLILGILLSAVPASVAQTSLLSFGPSLGVVTIPQDDQKLGTGVMILGIDPADPGSEIAALPIDLMSQHKLIITFNGQPLLWQVGTPGPTVFCSVYEKDKVNVIADPKSGLGKQGSWENLMTTMVDVSQNFVCKPRWKSPASGVLESVGVLDVYYVGPLPSAPTSVDLVTGATSGGVTGVSVGYFIADNILVVTAAISSGRTVIFGSDIQDICTLGWVPGDDGTAVLTPADPTWIITKPDGTQHYIFSNPLGAFLSCEQLALAERAAIGIPLPTGQDPLSTV